MLLGKNKGGQNVPLNFSSHGNHGVSVTVPADQNEPEITFDLPEEAMRVFQNEKFGEVRTCMVNGEAMFCGVDVAKILGYSDGFNAIKKHVDQEDRIVLAKNKDCQNDSVNFSRFGNTFINESGLFSLILGSKLESAKEFKHLNIRSFIHMLYRVPTFYVAEPTFYVAEPTFYV